MATATSESREDQAKKIKKALRVAPQTAAELAERMSKDGRPYSARGIGRTLGILVNVGDVCIHPGRVNKYTRP